MTMRSVLPKSTGRASDAKPRAAAPGERFTASFDAEETDFVRMNRGKVRQPGTVVAALSDACGSSMARGMARTT